MMPIRVLRSPSLSGEAGLRAAYLTADDAVVVVAGAAAWSFPRAGWRLAELERMTDALSVVLGDSAWTLLQQRCAATPAQFGSNTVVVQEPLLEQHLLPLVEAGELSPMEALRALAWTKLHP